MKFYRVTAGIGADQKINKIIYAGSKTRAREVFYRELDQPESLPGVKVIVEKIQELQNKIEH